MVLLENWSFFQLSFFRQYTPGNVLYDILEGKNVFPGNKIKELQKSKNSPFSKVHLFPTPMVLLKNWPFLELFFLSNIGQENVFYDILERKKRLSRE